MGDAGISDWVKLGVKGYDEYRKQKKTKRSGVSSTTREKYGGYANLALEANKLATGGGDSTPTSTPGYRTGRKIERVESTINIGDLKKISLDEEDDNKFYA